MEIKELKTKIKVVFPEESEIFMADEFLNELHKVDLDKKPVEMDFSGIQTIDTVFFQLAISIIKSVNAGKNKFTIKSSDILENAEMLYGIKLDNFMEGES